MYTYRKAFGCKSAPPIVIVWIRGGELATPGFEVSKRKDTLTDELRGKLERIFDLLVRNRQFNEAVQHAAYRQDVLPWPDTGSKLQSLLHSKAHTQSSPKLDVLMPTWKQLHQNYDAFKKARSPSDLNEALWTLAKPNIVRDRDNRPVFEEIRTALEKAAGFGKKTAALFVKSIVEIHTLPINHDLRFLPDFSIDPQDRLKIPVDTVIEHIFGCLGAPGEDFTSINVLIEQSGLSFADRPTLWDDLWFWGFITQMSGKETGRVNCINEPKFWSILGAPVDNWEQIGAAAEEFRQLVQPVEYASFPTLAKGNSVRGRRPIR